MTAETTPENALALAIELSEKCLPMIANGDGRELWHSIGPGGRVMVADFAGYDDYVEVLDSLLRNHGPYFAALAEKCRRLEAENVELRGVGAYKFGFAEGYESGSVDIHKWIRRAEQAEAERYSVREEAKRIERENIEGWKQASFWRQAAQHAVEERDAAVKNEQRYFWVERNAKVETQEWVYEPDEGYRPLSERVDAAMANSGEPK